MPRQSRERVHQPEEHKKPEEVAAVTGATAVKGVSPGAAERAEALKSETDGLLDEIDSILVENAEEFVRSYVQKGGQ